MPSFCAAAAIGWTGNPTIPNMNWTPCRLRFLATKVAPSTSAMSSLLSEWVVVRAHPLHAERATRGSRQVRSRPPEPESSPPGAARAVARERVVRPLQGGLHRGSVRPPGSAGGGSHRHLLPRRDRRGLELDPD